MDKPNKDKLKKLKDKFKGGFIEVVGAFLAKLEESEGEYYSTIRGTGFDVEKDKLLSKWNGTFFNCKDEFEYKQLDELIDYLTVSPVIKYGWLQVDSYNTLEYETRHGEKKLITGNPGMAKILRNLAIGMWNPNNVLADFCSSIRILKRDEDKDRYNTILEDVKSDKEYKFELTKKDYDHLKSRY